MHVTLQGFKIHERLNLDIPESSCCLVMGVSNAGKSTVFEAITWCLYGKIDDTSNWGSPNSTLSVTVEWNGVRIFRQRNPGLLTLESCSSRLEGIAAQNRIVEMYGSEDMWYCTSYVPQFSDNLFITSSSADKVAILSETALSSSHEVYMQKISDSIKDTSALVQQTNHTFEYIDRDLSNSMSRSNVNLEKDCRSPRQLREMDKEYKRLEDRIRTLEHSVREMQLQKRELELLTSSLNAIDSELSSLPVVELESLNDRQRAMEKYAKHRLLIKTYDNIKGELQSFISSHRLSLQDEGRTLRHFTKSDLSQAIALENEYMRNQRLAASLSVEYDCEAIRHELDLAHNQLKLQPLADAYDRYTSIEREIDALSQSISHYTESEADEARRTLARLELSRNDLECPSCKQKLRMLNGELKCTDHVEWDPSLHKQLKTIVTEYESSVHLRARIQYLREQLPSEKPILPNGFKRCPQSVLFRRVRDLESIVLVQKPPVPSSEIKLSIERLDLQRRVEDALKDVQSSACEPVDASTLERDRQHFYRRDALTKQRDSVSLQLSRLKVVQVDPQELESLKASKATLKVQLQKASEANRLSELRSKRDHLHNELEALNARLVNLQKIKALAIELECDILQSAVSSINSLLSYGVERLFDHSTTVELSLSKTLKTKKTQKQGTPTLNISRLGSTGIKFKSLCGGERAKINILLTLAWNSICGNNFMIFDETLSCLDFESKEKCVNLIRSIAPSATILIVSHDMDGGTVDHVLHI